MQTLSRCRCWQSYCGFAANVDGQNKEGAMAAKTPMARGESSVCLDRLASLRYEAESLRAEYDATFRDRDLADTERLAALAALTQEMKAVLTEAQLFIYG
jgi:hypothetical protein